MTPQRHPPPSFWKTVRLLLGAARRRANGRRLRQQQLLSNRAGKEATDWSGIGFVFAILLMVVVHVLAAFDVQKAVEAAQRAEAELQGKIVVSARFAESMVVPCKVQTAPWIRCTTLEVDYATEAKRIAGEFGGNKTEIETKLRKALGGPKPFTLVTEEYAAPGLSALTKSGRLPALMGSVMLLVWFVMLVCQGEGLELDIQRRRHPMWEWLFAHPIPAGAIFLADMLSPIAANPVYWSGPLFAGVLYGIVYGPVQGLAAALLVGIPLTVAAACLGKALEIAIILRCSPRSRGGLIGLMSWMGYASTMLFLLGMVVIPRVVKALAGILNLFTVVPWPWLRLFLGGQSDGSFSFLAGTVTCMMAAAVIIAAAVRFSVWGARRGLSGNFAADSRPSRSPTKSPKFGREPLYRKEFLWFIRDRSAIVQVILIPLTVAGVQVFNLRGILSHAEGAWNYLCGVGIVFGTYFLWILGPKSLASEGTALWIALTWPRGLESLLKAKAWLWSTISSVLVALILSYAVFLYPAEGWKIALVAIGWFFFGRSMAEKSVTLVSVTSESGETQKIPAGRRLGASLGMLTFAVGILTQQWTIAVVGIVYSYVTAAAMWQNFRAHLPYLYDPWSEKLPTPPTLMHAMIAISILIEGGAVLAGLLSVAFGQQNIAIAQAFSYGISAIAVSIGVSTFLENREVRPRDVWTWKTRLSEEDEEPKPWWIRYGLLDRTLLGWLLAGVAGGLVLGLFARGYTTVLSHFSMAEEIIRKGQQQMASDPSLRISYAIMAILFAPFAEEYLFRGLVFRALDREWGGWRAVLGGAAFFAIYHPAMAWLPVAMVGAANALLFKRSGWLAPAVALHLVYNAVVLF